MALIVQNRVPLRAGIASVSATIADATAPTVPSGLQATAASSSQINLSWNASSDNLGVMQSGVAAYRIRRDGAFLVDVAHPTLTYSDTGLVSSQTYGYTVAARDVAGNESAQSAAANATTNAATNQWLPFTGPTFIFGVASNWSFDPYDPSSASAFQWASGSAAPPAGVSLDSPGKRLVYSGGGSVGVTNNLILEDTQNAEADWQSRISGPGVVWYHDFRTANEVNNFRWTGSYGGGNDPLGVGSPLANWCRWISTDGITGGCLEQYHAAGFDEGSYWWRPFSPMQGGTTSGNGRGAGNNDPGGGVAVQTWTPTNGGSQTANWGRPNNPRRGLYCHSAYNTLNDRDGADFYVQLRVKMDPRRLLIPGETAGGKFIWFTHTWNSYTDQEIVTYSYGGDEGRAFGMNIFRMYRGSGFAAFEQLPTSSDASVPGRGVYKPQTDEYGTCDIRTPVANPCWAWSGGWDTVLYHITPGQKGVSNSRVEVWACTAGQEAGGYKKIWDQSYDMRDNFPNTPQDEVGWSALLLSAYNNGNLGTETKSEFVHRYAQVIFSKQFIPCPTV